MATPEAEADPGYLQAYPALYNAYPNWPGVSTPYFSSTCFGCRGKRSADAEPEAEAEADAYYGYGYAAPYAYAPYAYSPYRYAPGVAYHPTGTSFEARSPQGLGKRSADADAEPHYGYYGYGGAYAHGYGRGYGSPYAYGGYGYPYGYARW